MDPTTRFSQRVENYRRHRPGYPAGVLDTLRSECGLTTSSVIADIGSGTGILAEMFLKNGNQVYGVEPNQEMRAAGEQLPASYPAFQSIAGRAEATGLADASVDFVTAAQALHWFDLEKARAEFGRILKPAGWIVVVWNDRRDESPFMQAYRQLLLRHATDYLQVDHKKITPEVLGGFFRAPFQTRVFDNYQIFDYEGLEGRLLSSSYVPLESAKMVQELGEIFRAHQVDGKVRFEYETSLYYARV